MAIKTHCKRGHELIEANLYRYKNGRQCKICVINNVKTKYHTDPVFKQAHKITATKWRNTNRDKKNLQERLRAYHLTLDQYHGLQEKSDFHCALCDEVNDLEVDHDHVDGKVRGMLCHKHNMLLGLADDSPAILNKAISYLEKDIK